MTITLRETFQVQAPIEAVWAFVMDPHRVAACMPGAALDEGERAVEMLAEGRETGGGTARGTMSSRLRSLAGAETEVMVEASVDVTGRIAQVSRGMIQGVSQQLFKQFVACAKTSLETPENAAAAIERANRPVSVLPLVLRAVWAAVVRLFRRLLRRPVE